MAHRPGHDYPGTPDVHDNSYPAQGQQQQQQQYFEPHSKSKEEINSSEAKGEYYDVETHEGAVPSTGIVAQHGELNRAMKSRHIQMISIGGVIGTGLFLGTANALRHGGPLGLLLGYAVMGSVVWNVMASLGEMVSHLPVAGGHITLARRFVDPALSFTMGWNYWYNWTIVLPAELSAAAVLVNFWIKTVNNAAWITIFLVLVAAINLGGARFYAEFEFWFASIKVLTIVGLIILGIILDAGGGPDHDPIGFRYWRNPGAFVQYAGIPGALGRFLGFWSVLIQASFSYIGTEITAITAGEARNPKKSLPSAIRGVAWRILLFYILGTFIIGLLVPSNDPGLNLGDGTAASSPFVIAIVRSGIPALPSIINACLLTSAWSAASSDLYTSSRALYSLALAGNAPKFFTKTTSWGLPWICMIVGILFSLLSYMSAGSKSAGEVFGYFANMTSVAGLLTWVGILITYIRWDKGVKAQNIDRTIFPYRSALRTIGAVYALVLCLLILFFSAYNVFLNVNRESGFDTSDFVTSYLPCILFPILYVGSRAWFHFRGLNASPVAPLEMDFVSGARDETRDFDEEKPRTLKERFKAWV